MTKIAQHKKTTNSKLGYIPEDWKIKKVSQVFDFLSTNSFSRSQMNYSLKVDSIYNIHYGDIHATYKEPILDFDKNKDVPVINDDVELSKSVTFLKDGDLVMADASEDYKGVGDTVELVNVDKKKVLAGLHTFALRDRDNDTAPGYRTYAFRHPDVSKAIKVIATGSKVYGISKTNLTKIELILPPLPEQQKIATILSTWDKAIDKLTKLISAKEQRKKGLTQILLKGKKRFAGFKDEWLEVKLGDVFQINAGKDLNPNFFSEIHSNDFQFPVYSNKLTNNGLYGYYRTSDYVGGKITVTARGTLGHSNPRFEDFMAIGRLLVLTPKIKLDITFVSEFINNRIKIFIESTGVPQLTAPQFSIYKIKLPSLNEQQKIASVLSMADKEIKLLKNELARMQEQKKGLMQVLLKGKIRVKI